jgi:hypothetical protein
MVFCLVKPHNSFIRQSYPTAQMTLLHHLPLCRLHSLDFLAQAPLSVCSLIYFITSLPSSPGTFILLFFTPPLALLPYYTSESTIHSYFHNVLRRCRKILSVPMSLLQAQCRHVLGIRSKRSSSTRENSSRGLRLRKTFLPDTTSIGFEGRILRLWLWHGKP